MNHQLSRRVIALSGIFCIIIGGAFLLSSVGIYRNILASPLVICAANEVNLTQDDFTATLSITQDEVLRIFKKQVEFDCDNAQVLVYFLSDMQPYTLDVYNIPLFGDTSRMGSGAYIMGWNRVIIYPFEKDYGTTKNIDINVTPLNYREVNSAMLAHEIGHALGYQHRKEEDSLMHSRGSYCFVDRSCRVEERDLFMDVYSLLFVW